MSYHCGSVVVGRIYRGGHGLVRAIVGLLLLRLWLGRLLRVVPLVRRGVVRGSFSGGLRRVPLVRGDVVRGSCSGGKEMASLSLHKLYMHSRGPAYMTFSTTFSSSTITNTGCSARCKQDDLRVRSARGEK